MLIFLLSFHCSNVFIQCFYSVQVATLFSFLTVGVSFGKLRIASTVIFSVTSWLWSYRWMMRAVGRWRQRRQNNQTNYTRQKAHVNVWNKTDIRAVLLSNETSTAPFHAVFRTRPTFQELTSFVSFRGRRWGQRSFSERETYRVTNVLSKIRELRRNNFFLPPTLASPSSFA